MSEGEDCPFKKFRQMEVWVWREKLCTQANDGTLTFLEGIDCLMAASILFNVQLPGGCLKTWRFVREQVYRLEGPLPSMNKKGMYLRLNNIFTL